MLAGRTREGVPTVTQRMVAGGERGSGRNPQRKMGSHHGKGSPPPWVLSLPGVDWCPCVLVVLPRSSPAPHPTRSLHSSPSAGPFPAHLSCFFHGHRLILHSSSRPRYRKLHFSLFTDPLLPDPAGDAPQEDGGSPLGQGHPCHIPGARPGSSPIVASPPIPFQRGEAPRSIPLTSPPTQSRFPLSVCLSGVATCELQPVRVSLPPFPPSSHVVFSTLSLPSITSQLRGSVPSQPSGTVTAEQSRRTRAHTGRGLPTAVLTPPGLPGTRGRCFPPGSAPAPSLPPQHLGRAGCSPACPEPRAMRGASRSLWRTAGTAAPPPLSLSLSLLSPSLPPGQTPARCRRPPARTMRSSAEWWPSSSSSCSASSSFWDTT